MVFVLITAPYVFAGKKKIAAKWAKRQAKQEAATMAYHAALEKQKVLARMQLDLRAAREGQTVMHCTMCGHDELAPHHCAIYFIGTGHSTGNLQRRII